MHDVRRRSATPTTNSFNDTGLTAATSYSYRVRATRRGGEPERLLEYCDGDDTGDAGHAAADGAERADGDGGVERSQINLSWTAATDNVGVTGYRVERCQGAGCSDFAQVATPTATSVQRHGAGAGDELQLPGAGDGRGGEPERVLERGERDDAGGAGHAAADARRAG